MSVMCPRNLHKLVSVTHATSHVTLLVVGIGMN